MAKCTQQQTDTTLNMNMPMMTAALASREPFSFDKIFAFALELLLPRSIFVFSSSVALESAR